MDRIERLQRLSAAEPGVISFGGGLPSPDLFPRAALARAFVEAVAAPSAPALQYGWPEGNDGLRDWIARRLSDRGASVTASDVIITNGAQQALAIATDVLGKGDAVALVDAETYPAALDLFRSRGVRPTAVRSLPAAFTYEIPGVSNPRGLGLSAERRRELIDGSLPIIADEAYAELRFDGQLERPLVADARERVWHVGTFSKTLCPGLRVGFLIPPPEALDAALRVKRDTDLQAGGLAQAVLELFLSRDDFAARLVRSRAFYAKRAARLLRALKRHLPQLRATVPEGGFAVFVECDEFFDDHDFLDVAVAHGVSFDPGRTFRADERREPFALRLCFSMVSSGEIDEGAARLARAFASFSTHAHKAAPSAELR
jgi:2-aminoadipate transaminase